MATKAKDKRTRRWKVLSNGQEIIVQGLWEIEQGALIFRYQAIPVQAFADGAWTSVTQIEPEPE